MVKINDEFYIDADKHCYMLKGVTIVKGEQRLYTIGYYSNFYEALQGFLKSSIRKKLSTQEIISIRELADFIKATQKEIEKFKVIEEVIKGNSK